jgi:deoxyribose-phosphate aldolase
MVANLGWLLSGQWDLFYEEVKAIKEACGTHTLKVILETCYLDDKALVKATEKAVAAGADFVKTSTGFGPDGATTHAVALMAKAASGKGVKASGGVRSLADCEAMVQAGATRIGTSNGVAIVQGLHATENY